MIEPGRRATPCDLSRIPGPAALYFDNVSDMRIITRGASAKQLPALVAWPGRKAGVLHEALQRLTYASVV